MLYPLRFLNPGDNITQHIDYSSKNVKIFGFATCAAGMLLKCGQQLNI